MEKRLKATAKKLEFVDLNQVLSEFKGKLSDKFADEFKKTRNKASLVNFKRLKQKKYSEELMKQVAEKEEKAKAEGLEKMVPGFSELLKGYPSLQRLSSEELRVKRSLQKEILKKALDSQVRRQYDRMHLEVVQELEIDKKHNTIATESLRKDDIRKYLNKHRQAEILSKTWGQAAQLKRLKDIEESLVRKGYSHELFKRFIEKTGSNRVVKSKEISKDEKSSEVKLQELLITPQKTNEQSRSKSQVLGKYADHHPIRRLPPYPKPLFIPRYCTDSFYFKV